MNLKTSLVAAAVIFGGASIGQSAVTLSGTAFLNAPGIAVGDIAVFIIDEANTNLSASFAGITAGESLTSASTFGNGDFTVLSPTKTFTQLSTFIRLDGTYNNIPLAGDVSSGDRIYAVVFSTSTDTAVAGDTYTVWTDPTWIVPSDGATVTFASAPTGSQFRQFTSTSTPVFIGTVTGSAIPEPASYALFAGLGFLSFAACKRRR